MSRAVGGVARGVFTLTSGRLIGIGLSLLQIKVVTSYLGPLGYGRLTAAVIFVAIFSAFADAGIGAVVVRRVSSGRESLESAISTYMALSILAVLPLVLIVVAGGRLVYQSDAVVAESIALLSVGLAADTWSTCYFPVAQIRSSFGTYVMVDLASKAVGVGLTILVVEAGRGILWVVAVQAVAPVLRAIGLTATYKSSAHLRPSFRGQPMVSLLRESVPIAGVLLIGVLYFRIDGLILSKLSTPDQVGGYGLAYRIAANLSVVAMSLQAVLLPRLSSEWGRNVSQFRASLSMALRMIGLVALAVGVIGWPFSRYLVEFVGSREFVSVAAQPLGLIMLATAMAMLSAVLSAGLLAASQQRYLLIVNSLVLLLNVALNVLLIPHLGASGAATALVASEVIGLAAALFKFRSLAGSVFPYRPLLIAGALAMVIAAGAEGLLRAGTAWFLVGPACLAAFGLGALASRVIGWSEVSFLWLRRPTETSLLR